MLIEVSNHLWLNVVFVLTVVIQPLDLQLAVKMADVAHNGVLQHL